LRHREPGELYRTLADLEKTDLTYEGIETRRIDRHIADHELAKKPT